MARARASATRCASPPLSSAGRCDARVGDPDRVEQLERPRSPRPARTAAEGHRQLDVLGRGEGAEQTEVLEDEADRLAAVAREVVAL